MPTSAPDTVHFGFFRPKTSTLISDSHRIWSQGTSADTDAGISNADSNNISRIRWTQDNLVPNILRVLKDGTVLYPPSVYQQYSPSLKLEQMKGILPGQLLVYMNKPRNKEEVALIFSVLELEGTGKIAQLINGAVISGDQKWTNNDELLVSENARKERLKQVEKLVNAVAPAIKNDPRYRYVLPLDAELKNSVALPEDEFPIGIFNSKSASSEGAWLRKYSDKPLQNCVLSLKPRFQEADLLQREVVQTLREAVKESGKPVVYNDLDAGELKDILDRGIIFGIYDYNKQDGKKLAAFRSFYIPIKGDSYNLGRDVGLPESELDSVIHSEAVYVSPTYNKNGFQKLTARYALPIVMSIQDEHGRPRFRHLLATVHPQNPASISSKLESGIPIVMLEPKYGPDWRFIFYRDMAKDLPELDTRTSIKVPSKDYARQIELLNQNYIGHRIERLDSSKDGSEALITYSKPKSPIFPKGTERKPSKSDYRDEMAIDTGLQFWDRKEVDAVYAGLKKRFEEQELILTCITPCAPEGMLSFHFYRDLLDRDKAKLDLSKQQEVRLSDYAAQAELLNRHWYGHSVRKESETGYGELHETPPFEDIWITYSPLAGKAPDSLADTLSKLRPEISNIWTSVANNQFARFVENRLNDKNWIITRLAGDGIGLEYDLYRNQLSPPRFDKKTTVEIALNDAENQLKRLNHPRPYYGHQVVWKGKIPYILYSQLEEGLELPEFRHKQSVLVKPRLSPSDLVEETVNLKGFSYHTGDLKHYARVMKTHFDNRDKLIRIIQIPDEGKDTHFNHLYKFIFCKGDAADRLLILDNSPPVFISAVGTNEMARQIGLLEEGYVASGIYQEESNPLIGFKKLSNPDILNHIPT